MREASAFSPCHITGFFSPRLHDEPLRAGSLGAGVCIDRGCWTRVRVRGSGKPSWTIFINDQKATDAVVSERVIERFLSITCAKGQLTVHQWHGVPIGYGLGSSGAGALSLSLALNDLFEAGLSRTRIAQIAHEAEVTCRTGLGTVLAEFTGGLVVRQEPGAPGIGRARRVRGAEGIVIALPVKRMSTRKVLSRRDIAKETANIHRFITSVIASRNPIRNFLRVSRLFAKQMGIADRKTRFLLGKLEATGTWSVAMLGQTPFTIVRPERLSGVWRQLVGMGIPRHRILASNMAQRGARSL